MSEILFIAIDPCILALIEDLQPLLAPAIGLESDYTSGIKRIFDTRPSIVFLQHMIGNVTCDKLANQVKMLLDGEEVPLVLLSEESVTSYSVVSTYAACFDLCLPLDELSWQVQQLLHTLPGIAWKEPATPKQTLGELPPETSFEISLPDGIADFSLPLPWHEDAAGLSGAEFLPAGGGTLDALEGNAVTAAERPRSSGPEEAPFLADFLEDRFAIEPIPLTFDAPPLQEKPAPTFAATQKASFSDVHRIEKEAPNLIFGSMSESREAPSFTLPRPVGPRQVAKEEAGARPASAAPRGATATAQGSDSTATPSPSPLRRQAAVEAEQAGSLEAEDLDLIAARLGIKKRYPWYVPAAVIGLLLVVCIVSVDLFFTLRHGLGESAHFPGTGGPEARLHAPGPATPVTPQFLPQVAPDAGYPASHPGWQRYQADGLEYLVYREKGSLRAIQVLSRERGALTSSFLKSCIRVSTGHEQFVVKKTEERNGIKITSATLQNGGELEVYRAVPDGEIRGFVVSFPVASKVSTEDAKK